MPKNKNRYEIHVDGELHSAYKTRRSASMVAVSLRVEGDDAEIIDTEPAKKKPKTIKGDGFVMEEKTVIKPSSPKEPRGIKRAPSRNLIETMHRRGQITLQQNAAADRYYYACMVSSGQKNLTIDYAKERVDTFGNGESIQMSELKAKQDFQDAIKVLSKLEIYRLQSILIQGSTLRRYCLSTYATDNTRRQQKESQALKQSLTTLAVLWGYENKGRKVA